MTDTTKLYVPILADGSIDFDLDTEEGVSGRCVFCWDLSMEQYDAHREQARLPAVRWVPYEPAVGRCGTCQLGTTTHASTDIYCSLSLERHTPNWYCAAHEPKSP